MEPNVQDDHLEKFIKESFDSLESMPRDEVWDRINQDLNKHIPLPSKYNKQWYWAIAASLLGLVMIALIYTNLSLRQQLNEVTAAQEKEQQHIITDIESEQDDTSEEKASTNTSTKVNANMDTLEKKSDAIEENLNSSDTRKPIRPDETIYPTHNKINRVSTNDESVHLIQKKQVIESKINILQRKVTVPDYRASNKKEISNTTSIYVSQPNTYSVVPTPNQLSSEAKQQFADRNENSALNIESEMPTSNIASEVKERSTLKLFNVVTLTPLRLTEVFAEQKLNALALPRINPMAEEVLLPRHRTLSIGSYVGLLSESGHIESIKRSLPTLHPIRSAFRSTYSWQAGIRVENSLDHQWRIQSGMGLKHYDLLNELNQVLVFRERRPKPGNKPFQYDWDLKLNSAGGTSSIEVRSEQVDTRSMLSENELIKVNIRNKSELYYLSIPLTIGYQWGRGTWSAQFNGGLNADFLILKKFEQPRITLEHALLKLRSEHPVVKFNQSNPVVFNGLLGAALQYKHSKSMQLYFSPSLYLPLNHRDRNRDVRIETHSFGIQLGIQYNLNSL